jgi:carbonic anhydrase
MPKTKTNKQNEQTNGVKMKNLLLSIAALVALASCAGNNKTSAVAEAGRYSAEAGKVLSAEEQSKLTPDKVLETLKQGNKAFASDQLSLKNNTERVRNAAKGQHPEAVILSCLDSRVPVEDIFNRGIGDVFVARVAGNIVNPDILGSLEYACKVSGAKLIVVLGHGHCGAIKSAIDGVELGNITGLLSKIKPAVEQSKANFQGETSSSNPEFVEKVCQTNVEWMVKEIRKDSPILKEMEDKGEIKMVGAIYDMENGKVEFFENI